jgi:hypothetical protein
LKGFLALSFLRELGAADLCHDLGVQMELVEPFWLISEGKEKLGIGNFGPFFLQGPPLLIFQRIFRPHLSTEKGEGLLLKVVRV